MFSQTSQTKQGVTALNALRQRRKDVLLALRGAVLLTALSLCFQSFAQAQANPEIAGCLELRDETTRTQADLCSAHIGCKLVMGIHSTCAKAKAFLDRLSTVRSAEQQASFNDGGKKPLDAFLGALNRVTSVISGEKPVTANQVFEASLTANQKTVQDVDPEWGDRTRRIRQTVASQPEQVLPRGGGYYMGSLNPQGQPDGWGVEIWPNGQMTRGRFVQGHQEGLLDYLDSAGVRRTGLGKEHRLNGDGVVLLADGRQLTFMILVRATLDDERHCRGVRAHKSG